MTRPMTFVILADRPDLSQALRNALASDRRVRIVAESDDAEQMYEAVVRYRPSAVIIPVSRLPEEEWALCRQINAVCPETVIICAVRNSSNDLILDSLRSGAREFLRLPINADELKTVLDRTAEFSVRETPSSKKRGRVIAVFSNKGGCGVSFIAANIAVAMGASTGLADLNLQTGGIELFFGLKPKFSIMDLVENSSRLDDRLVAGFLTPYSDNLTLLTAPQDAEAAEDLRPENVVEVIDILRERYDNVVLDLPHTFDAITIAALDNADEILLVVTLDILAARAAQRSLAIFGRLGYSRQKIRVVMNRWSKQSDLQLQYVERYLGDRVAFFISDDYRTVVNSINLGRPIITSATSSTVVAELKRLAAACGATSTETEGPKRSGIDMLRTLFRRQTEPLGAATQFDDEINRNLETKDR